MEGGAACAAHFTAMRGRWRTRVSEDVATVEAASPRDAALRRAGKRLLREPALLLSLAYLATSALGLWANFWLYHPFGIPIFEYMQPSDLLVAGLHDPMYLLLVVAGFGFSWTFRWWERWRFANPDRVVRLRRHWWGRMWLPTWRERASRTLIGRALFRAGAVLYLAFTGVFLYTQAKTERMLRGEGQPVSITFADGSAPLATSILIGTTANWVFVYRPDQRRADVIAQQSLRSLAYPVVADTSPAPSPSRR